MPEQRHPASGQEETYPWTASYCPCFALYLKEHASHGASARPLPRVQPMDSRPLLPAQRLRGRGAVGD